MSKRTKLPEGEHCVRPFAFIIRLRPLESSDVPLLPRFLAFASHEEDEAVILANPSLVRYIQDWGRKGDVGVVAQDLETGQVIGMAWARLWTPNNRGFAWIDEQTPELAIAVEPQFQKQGVGAQMVEALQQQLRQLGTKQLSLSVRCDSPAVRFYQRLGFSELAGTRRQNRTGGHSFIMVARL